MQITQIRVFFGSVHAVAWNVLPYGVPT